MKAAVFKGQKLGVEYTELEEPKVEEGHLKVKVLASALNRRDFYITQGLYPGVSTPVILGSDACVEHEGKRYLVNPNINWGDDQEYQGDDYHILGMPSDGAFAEMLSCGKDRLHRCPDFLSDAEAAALPLAGLTAFRALFSRAKLKKGDSVFISGFGGGVASMAFLFAKAFDCAVYVSSSSEEKREKALEMGAKAAFDYTQKAYGKEMYKQFGGADVVIESAGGKQFNEILDLCKKGARVAMYGGTAGMMAVSPQKLFWRQISILGSTMGSDADFSDMMTFVEQYKIKPIVSEVFLLSNINQALELMAKGGQIGKIVLDNTK